MKKILLFLILLELVFIFNQKNYLVSSEQSYFARIKQDEVYIYSSPEKLNDNSNQIFMLPKTYFVEVIEKTNDSFFKVKYIDIIGYVKKEEITFVKGNPITPFNNKMTFRVFATNGIDLRKSPNTLNGLNDLVVNIPFLSSNISFYGQRLGEEWIIYKGNVWYYCKYIHETKEYFGYVYSAYCDLVVENDINNETIEETTEPNFTQVETPVKDPISKLSKPNQVLIICLSSLPCILIVYLLFKPSKNLTKNKEPKKKIKRLRKSDYFEFDDEMFKN